MKQNAPQFGMGFEDHRQYEIFRNGLRKAGYCEIAQARDAKPAKPEIAALYESLSANEPLGTLVRLFHLCVPALAEQVRAALCPLTLEALISANLLCWEGAKVRATVRLQSYEGLILASDVPKRIFAEDATDQVVSVSGTTRMLANATVRLESRRILDVGTGNGVQALLAARHSDHVIGVDLSPRAIAFAEFNARLNGITNAEFRQGSFFEPVAGERFDLIVANPPFVISPESRFVYRDNLFEGDGLCQWFLEQAPAYLEEGGFFQMLCNWAKPPEAGPHQRFREWLERTGCDAWVMHLDTDQTPGYAANWIQQTENHDAEAFIGRFDRWMSYFEELGIEAISLGIVTLRQRQGVNWVRIEHTPAPQGMSAGESVLQAMQTGAFLETLSTDEELLDHSFRAAEGLEWNRKHALTDEGLETKESRLKLTGGLPFEGSVDGVLIRLLHAADGERSLGEVIEELTAAGHLADWPEVAPEFLAAVRKLILAGFLTPVEMGNRRDIRIAVGRAVQP